MKTHIDLSRRELVRLTAVGAAVASGTLLVASSTQAQTRATDEDEDDEKSVGATEDLMREHGVLRRTLIVYSESAARLNHDAAHVAAPALADAARLFREFGERYHEKMLEEQYIFPVVRKVGRDEATLVDTLIAQHRRGSEITDYIESVTRNGRIAAAQMAPLASAMAAMARMYEPHAAREDTVVFPAWKAALSEDRLEELGEKFEDIEHEQFGHDGFEDAVQRIARIEQTLGMADLAAFTAPPPPSSA